MSTQKGTSSPPLLLREKDKVWLVAGVEGIEAGDELTYDYGSDHYPRKANRSE
jgi:hypothetical protein